MVHRCANHTLAHRRTTVVYTDFSCRHISTFILTLLLCDVEATSYQELPKTMPYFFLFHNQNLLSPTNRQQSTTTTTPTALQPNHAIVNCIQKRMTKVDSTGTEVPHPPCCGRDDVTSDVVRISRSHGAW